MLGMFHLGLGLLGSSHKITVETPIQVVGDDQALVKDSVRG